jgi:hypothetical protein
VNGNISTQRVDSPSTAIATAMATTALMHKAQSGLRPMAPPLLPLLPLVALLLPLPLPLLLLLPLLPPVLLSPGPGVGIRGGSVAEDWDKSEPVGI